MAQSGCYFSRHVTWGWDRGALCWAHLQPTYSPRQLNEEAQRTTRVSVQTWKEMSSTARKLVWVWSELTICWGNSHFCRTLSHQGYFNFGAHGHDFFFFFKVKALAPKWLQCTFTPQQHCLQAYETSTRRLWTKTFSETLRVFTLSLFSLMLLVATHSRMTDITCSEKRFLT